MNSIAKANDILYTTERDYGKDKDDRLQNMKTVSETLKILTEPIQEIKTNPSVISLNEGVSLISWKMVANISAKLLDFDDETLTVECLIDKENRIYEEYEYEISPLFQDLNLVVGMVFKISHFERPNQQMTQIRSKPELVAFDDFPTINFSEKFSYKTFVKKK